MAIYNQLQDIAGVDLQHETSTSSSSMRVDPASTRLHPSSSSQHLHMLSPSPQAASYMNGVASSDLAVEENNKLDHESHLQRLTSPIIADLPLISMRSPPLSLDFAASEVCMILCDEVAKTIGWPSTTCSSCFLISMRAGAEEGGRVSVFS